MLSGFAGDIAGPVRRWSLAAISCECANVLNRDRDDDQLQVLLINRELWKFRHTIFTEWQCTPGTL